MIEIILSLFLALTIQLWMLREVNDHNMFELQGNYIWWALPVFSWLLIFSAGYVLGGNS